MTLFLHLAHRALRAFLGSLVAVVALFLVVDFAENASAFHGPNWGRWALELYANKAAVVAWQTGPAALLLAAAVTASGLRRTREYTAMRALGLGPWRVALPVLAVALADGGRLEPAGGGESMQLVLRGGAIHREEPAGDYVVASFARATLAVGLGGALGERNRLTGSPFELRADEIGALAAERGARNPEEGRRWRAFLHRRIAGPAGILAFALLAVPIAASRRGGRAFGYAATLLSVVGYYSVMRLGEGLAQRGVLAPWVGPHLANLVGAAVGILAVLLMSRRGAGAVR